MTRLLHGAPLRQKDDAWEAFVAEYTPLLLRVAKRATRDRDSAMDAYAFVLEGLRGDDFRRLRRFEADGRSQFKTWLVVVAQRLCHDFHRVRYGRSKRETRSEELRARARLVDLVGSEIELSVVASGDADAEKELRRRELQRALAECLAALPPGEQLLLVWRFEEDLPVREIRALIGAPSIFHVYRKIRSVLDTLRRKLESRGITEGRP